MESSSMQNKLLMSDRLLPSKEGILLTYIHFYCQTFFKKYTQQALVLSQAEVRAEPSVTV